MQQRARELESLSASVEAELARPHPGAAALHWPVDTLRVLAGVAGRLTEAVPAVRSTVRDEMPALETVISVYSAR